MITLVLGGSGSGKSAYAEEVALHSSLGNRYYLATMEVYGEEGRKKVERHKALRRGKGFITVEQTRNLTEVLPKITGEDSLVLLECASNLVANEMFTENRIVEEELVTEKILKDILVLEKHVNHLVIVSNNVFEDGITYAEETRRYMRALGKINAQIADQAERVVELVVGIPVVIKE